MDIEPIRQEKHHWWPKVLSRYWKGEDGRVGAIKPNGKIYRSSSHKHGQIKNGHTIFFGASRADANVWDHCFEHVFDNADSSMNSIVECFEDIVQNTDYTDQEKRFIPCSIQPELHRRIVTSMISLCIRGPMNRNMAISLPEQLRGSISEPERSRLIASNLQHSQGMWERAISDRGKYIIAYTPDTEFIFGDGFYHNLTTQGNACHSPEYFIPITPHIALGYVAPIECRPNPRFHTIKLNESDVAATNEAVQVYAKDVLFFSNKQPTLSNSFTQQKHLEYESHWNPIRTFLYSIPGVIS